MTDREMLIWFHQRMIHVYKESAYVDFLHRLRCIIKNTPRNSHSGSFINDPNRLLESLEKPSEWEKRELEAEKTCQPAPE